MKSNKAAILIIVLFSLITAEIKSGIINAFYNDCELRGRYCSSRFPYILYINFSAIEDCSHSITISGSFSHGERDSADIAIGVGMGRGLDSSYCSGSSISASLFQECSTISPRWFDSTELLDSVFRSKTIEAPELDYTNPLMLNFHPLANACTGFFFKTRENNYGAIICTKVLLDSTATNDWEASDSAKFYWVLQTDGTQRLYSSPSIIHTALNYNRSIDNTISWNYNNKKLTVPITGNTSEQAIAVYDVFGKLIFQDIKQVKSVLEFDPLPTGIYYIQLKYSSGNTTKKIFHHN